MRNWSDVLPARIAARQTAYERAALVLRARKAGLTLREIGEHMGIGPERARQLEDKAVRRAGMLSPFEEYAWQRPEIYELQDKLKRL